MQPEKWVQPMAKAGADRYTFHLEAVPTHESRLEIIKVC